MDRRKFITSTTALSVMSLMPLSGFSFPGLSEFSKDELMGKADIKLYGSNKIRLRKDAFGAYIMMYKAAKQKGITIQAVSSYRSFEDQKRIWTNKYNRFTAQGMNPLEAMNKIIEYSTIPGTSRHHWGTDIDIIMGDTGITDDVLQEKHFEEGGAFYELKQWLTKFATTFGFEEVYTNQTQRKGFKYEPWHFSYSPTSKPMLKAYRNLDVFSVLSTEDFAGSEHFTTDFLTRYINENIMDINPVLLPEKD
ncbi:hypothetical protein GCM10009117_23590 [Gangjinia marincola]|uniref:D-alanyl-D-alanine carboxypeptidase-like core domain-containing protein n=1 Tax=Gangjinia marincola TaxID=578463 RepID=A0ABP3Y0C8_9FLAO